MKLRYKILGGIGAVLLVGIGGLMLTLAHTESCPAAPAAVPAEANSMRAIAHRCYGDPGVLRVERVPKPAPGTGQILIKVRAAGLNPYDWHMTTGKPYILRLFKGIGAPDSTGAGSDFAGVIEAVGAGVTRFKAGDEVFGGQHGALADYVVADERGDLVLKPAELPFDDAAGLAIAGVTALQGLRDHGGIAAGQKVLINGASGGVGTFAIQIAKSYGAVVTAVCSTRNVELVRALGADHVIDYTTEDFTKGTERYDLILDTAGNHGLSELGGALTPKGTLVAIGGSKTDHWIGPVWNMAKRKVVAKFVDHKLASFVASVSIEDLEVLATLARDGKLRTHIDRRYELEDTGAALEYIGTRRARGKVIVTVH